MNNNKLTLDFNTKTNTKKMTSKLIYDIKGNVNNVEKHYSDMSDDEITELMKNERFSLTCAPGGENNMGMEIIGRMPIKGEGFTSEDIEGLAPYFENLMSGFKDDDKVNMLNLNNLSENNILSELMSVDQARVLILRDWATKTMGAEGWTKEVYKELACRRWDAEYLDPNKYRTEIIDGKEVSVRGKIMNKLARTNLCFVANREQDPSIFEGKGTIYNLKKMNILNKGVEKLKEQISAGLIEIGSKTKVDINVVEGNRYYNLKNTGIGFHGDTERVVVICISIGCDNYPMCWQWFKDGMPLGKTINATLNSGDVYIMSEKAVGSDWKKKSWYTVRHAVGADKYRSLSGWENKIPEYDSKIMEKAANNVDKANKRKTTKNGTPKKVDLEKLAIRKYKNALRKHDWNDTDASFYRWVVIQSDHDISPNSQFFKEFVLICGGKVENYAKKMDIDEWRKHRKFYRNLCAHGVSW